MSTEAPAEAALPPEQFAAALRAVGEERYHHRHPYVAVHPLSACWSDAPGMNAFRGEDWMREACRSCSKRHDDFGRCRCQAFELVGDPTVADPACSLSPHHQSVVSARAARGETISGEDFRYRARRETIELGS